MASLHAFQPPQRPSEDRRREQAAHHVLFGLARPEHHAHDGSTREKQFAFDVAMRELLVECRQQLAYPLGGQDHTRFPIVESMKIFRLRKGGGDEISRCARRLSELSMKTGV